MSILIKATDTFSVSVAIGIIPGSPVRYVATLADKKTDAAIIASWPKDTEVHVEKFTFKSAGFKINSEIIDSSVEIVNGSVRINSATLRYVRLAKTLVGWSLVDEDKQPIPVTEENIACLPSAVAAVLGEELDKSQDSI